VLRRVIDSLDVFRGEASADGTIVLPLTQDDIAQLAGTTRSTANRVLRAEQRAGSLKIRRGRLDIVDPLLLRRHAF
jgi:CRP-like cAMP-binding protein